MGTTQHLQITLLQTAQSQKEVTVNEALVRMDALLNTAAESRSQVTPPASPQEGDTYIVPPGATGAWAGKDHAVAFFYQIWHFITPRRGLRLYVRDEGRFAVYDSGWLPEHMFSRRLHGIGLSGATRVIDPYHGEVQMLTLDQAVVALSLSGAPSGRMVDVTLLLQQDATGNRTVTWGSGIHWPASIAPVLTTTPNAIDSVGLYTTDGGANWYGSTLALGYHS